MTKTGERIFRQYWQLKYWPTWIGIGFLRFSCFLSLRLQICLGKAIGRLAHSVATERRAISRRNIELCFPELSAKRRNKLALEHFEALGASLMELGLARWSSIEKLRSITEVTGAQHVNTALKQGKNVILLSAHFTTLEICTRVLRDHIPPFDIVYRPLRNELLTHLILSSRKLSGRMLIQKNDIKKMVRNLRTGTPVWYAPDQAYQAKHSALIPFFRVPARTNIATTTLANLGKAVAIPYFTRRLKNGRYRVELLPPIQGLPSNDPVKDTEKYLEVLEEHIRKCPEQFYWVHRRFKGLPEPLGDVYADLDSLK